MYLVYGETIYIIGFSYLTDFVLLFNSVSQFCLHIQQQKRSTHMHTAKTITITTTNVGTSV